MQPLGLTVICLLAACAGAVYLLRRQVARAEFAAAASLSSSSAATEAATTTAPAAAAATPAAEAPLSLPDPLAATPAAATPAADSLPDSLAADCALYALVALFLDCKHSGASLTTFLPALASLAAGMEARNDVPVKLALTAATSARSALLARKTRVLGSAKRLCRMQCKRTVADFEAVDVTVEQLRVWAAVLGTPCSAVTGVVDCAFAASLLLASRQRHAAVIGLRFHTGLRGDYELGCVASVNGLCVVSAAGPGLQRFEPHSRNEFSVVLAQADGSVPQWLNADDVTVTLSSSPPASADSAEYSTEASVPVVTVAVTDHSVVSVVYGGLHDDAQEAVLQLLVCGACVADLSGEGEWGARVLPRDSKCRALGAHVSSLAVVQGGAFGMAVSADEKWLAVGLRDEGVVLVYSLPGGELVRTFGGGKGARPLQFKELYRLCFAPNGNLVVVDGFNQRMQEVTLEGAFVRFIGVGEFGDGEPFCVAVHDDVMAVGCCMGTGLRVVLFDFDMGAVTSSFGELGTAPGQLSRSCTGIRLTADSSHVLVAESEARRLSIFTAAGVFVRCVGVGLLGAGDLDVVLSATGECVVADESSHRVRVFSHDGSKLARSWGVRGSLNGEFRSPASLAVARQHLYVMDKHSGRVQVFE